MTELQYRPLKRPKVDDDERDGAEADSQDSFDAFLNRVSPGDDAEHDRVSSGTLYDALPEGCIRVLRLTGTQPLAKEDTGVVDIAITCELQTISMEDVRAGKKTYDALSYVWGSPSSDRRVICNGIPRPVTDNLFSALWHIFTDTSDLSTYLWVDALCINQADLTEKSQQVGMMGDIYRTAEIVTVWLGTGAEQGGPGLDEFWDWVARGNGDSNGISVKTIQAGNIFLERCDWFRRSWTFQEIVLARHAQVRRGQYMTDWPGFCKRFRDLQRKWRLIHHWDSPPTWNTDPESELTELERLVSPIEEVKEWKPGQLWSLMRYSAGRVSSEPRDVVFSLLSLWETSESIVPDYTMTVASTFAQAAAQIARELGHLWFLNAIDLAIYNPIMGPRDPDRDYHSFEGVIGQRWSNSTWISKSWIPSFDSIEPDAWQRLGQRESSSFANVKVNRMRFLPMDFDVNLRSAQISVCGVLLGHSADWGWPREKVDIDQSASWSAVPCVESLPACIRSRRSGPSGVRQFTKHASQSSIELVNMFDILLQICQHKDRLCSCAHIGTEAIQTGGDQVETDFVSHDLSKWYKEIFKKGEHVLICWLGGFDRVLMLRPVFCGDEDDNNTQPQISFDLVSRMYQFRQGPSGALDPSDVSPSNLGRLIDESGWVYTRFNINGGEYTHGRIYLPDRGYQ